MVFHKIRSYFSILILLFLFGCSTKKNTRINRTFHNITAKYNGYFNANEIVKKEVKGIEKSHKDDYEYLLPLFIYGSEEQAKSLYPQMDEAIKKCSEVIDRHSMVFRNKEYCKWIDDNYFLIGKASFYKKDYPKAIELFNYVSKNYKENEIRFDALLWLARTYGEKNDLNKANNYLKLAINDKKFPEELKIESKLIEADLSLKQKNYRNAVVQLETVTSLVKKRKTKARITFILAQIYQERNDSEKAIRAYNRVLKLRPDYEMAFYANINQALAFNNKGSSDAIKAKLNKMLKDNKNKEFFDQIYYALADIALKERKREEGISLLQQSASASVDNNRQKAKSFLRLANLHFEDRTYQQAQQYYDSTSSVIAKDHDAYEMVLNRKESLTQLVTNLKTISREDSLQNIAAMDEDERNLFIDNLIIQEIEDEEQRIRDEEMALLNLNNNQTPIAGLQSGGWYFYNINAMNFGKTEFSQRWGNRSLNDDWRRRNKESNTTGADFANATQATNATSVGDRASYLANIPLTQNALDSSNAKLDNALYSNGILYKEKLNDIANAIEAFEELTARFNTSTNLLTAYYQLYRLYLQKETSAGANYVSFDARSSSAYYKDKILLDYPDSEFAELIRDPNYKKEEDLNADRELNDYAHTYDLYQKQVYDQALIRSNSAINNEPDNLLLPKYYLIKAQILVAINDKAGYTEALTELSEKYVNSEEGKLAKDLLTRMENYDPSTAKGPVEFIDNNIYSMEDDAEHYFILVFPDESDFSRGLKNNIIQFNDRYYRNTSLKIAQSYIDNENQLMILRSFESTKKGMAYYKMFVTNTDVLSSLNKQATLKKFIISTKNFSELFRNKDVPGYETFFDKNYIK
ncbi:MAG: tetratricopeptide (TPR) repeat protein [Flavobacteriales bacterium]|jgi:tetratricopeptide (TPR) repeat protein